MSSARTFQVGSASIERGPGIGMGAAVFAACAGLCIGGGAISLGSPQTYDWVSPASGSWFEPTNWNPAAVPSSNIDTAVVGGALPLTVDVVGANALIGFLRVNNPAATLSVRSGRTLSIGQGFTLNGLLTIGEEKVNESSIVKLGTLFNADVLGTGRVLLRAPATDPTSTQILVPAGRMSMWSKDVLIGGTGSLVGSHRILGTVLANDAGGAAIEFRSGLVDGFGTGKFIADGAVLRLYQSQVTDASLEAKNGGRIELSAPGVGPATTELLKRAVVRGDMRCIFNTTKILDTDFAGNLQILPGAGAYFGGYTKPTNMTVLVRSTAAPGASTLTFATGTPPGGGEIVLNAATVPREAILFVDQAKLGGAWALRGQGLIEGSFALDGTIVADRLSGPELLCWKGTIDGPGTIEARGGIAAFGEDSKLNNLHLLSTQGGHVEIVNDSIISHRSTWTNVVADSPVSVTNLSELLMGGSQINGDLSVVGGFVSLKGTASTINGDIYLLFKPPGNGSGLQTDPGISLFGSGKIVLRSPSNNNWSGLSGTALTLPETREVHGSGILSGTMQIRGPMFVNDPAGFGLWFSGDISGSGENTIEISTGELILSRPGSVYETATASGFKVHALAGAKPVRIGYGSFQPSGDPRVILKSMDFDAAAVVSQYKVQLTDCIFRRPCEIRYGVICEIFGNSRFDSDLVLTPSDTGSVPLVIFRAAPAAPLPRVLFANRLSGLSAGFLAPDFAGDLNARLEGTGTLTSPKVFGGTIAPSDESSGSAAGVLYVQNSALNFSAAGVFEADILSTLSYDRIEAPKGAVANGTLKISMPEGVYPPPAFNFHLIRGSTTGAFANVIGPPGYRVTMTYNKAGALARLERICGSDLNGDGLVDDTDFAMFCVGYDLFDCADAAMPENCPADLNRDRVVDDTDFSVFVHAYAQMVCPDK